MNSVTIIRHHGEHCTGEHPLSLAATQRTLERLLLTFYHNTVLHME